MSDGDERDTTIARLRQENDRLRAENNEIRPRYAAALSELTRLKRHHDTEHHPHDLPPSDPHG